MGWFGHTYERHARNQGLTPKNAMILGLAMDEVFHDLNVSNCRTEKEFTAGAKRAYDRLYREIMKRQREQEHQANVGASLARVFRPPFPWAAFGIADAAGYRAAREKDDRG